MCSLEIQARLDIARKSKGRLQLLIRGEHVLYILCFVYGCYYRRQKSKTEKRSC